VSTPPRAEITIGAGTDGLGLDADVGVVVAGADGAVATGIEAGVGLTVDVHPATTSATAMATRGVRESPGFCITS
jgi:hypothetical protein